MIRLRCAQCTYSNARLVNLLFRGSVRLLMRPIVCGFGIDVVFDIFVW